MSNFPDIFMLTPLFSPIFISYHCWVQLPFLVDLPDDVELRFLKIKYVLYVYIDKKALTFQTQIRIHFGGLSKFKRTNMRALLNHIK